MELRRDDLSWAVREGFLTQEAAERLWAHLEERAARGVSVNVSPSTGTVREEPLAAISARFDLVHVAWYAGTLLILGAMGWFATLGFEAWGGTGICIIAVLYGALFSVAGWKMWRGVERKVLGALLVTAAVGMVPLAVYGLERATGIWPDHDPGRYAGFYDWINGGWFAMEVASIAAGVVAFRFVRFPFVGLPVAISVWFLSMDVAPLLFNGSATDRQRGVVSVVVGVACVVLAWIVRFRGEGRLLFWIEAFGLLTIDGGLAQLHSDDVTGKLIVLAVHLAYFALFVRSRNGAYAVFGLIGVVGLSVLAASEAGWGSHSEDGLVLAIACVLAALGSGLALLSRRAAYESRIANALFQCASLTFAFGFFMPLKHAHVLPLYAVVAAVLVLFGVFVRNRGVVGIAGCSVAAYLVYLANDVFEGSMMFPIVLVSIGLLLIGAGVFFQKKRDVIDSFVESALPPFLARLRPPA